MRPSTSREVTRTVIVVEEAATPPTNATTVMDAAEEAVQPKFNATIPVQAGVGNDTRPTVRITSYPQIERTEEAEEPNGIDPETGTVADAPVGNPKGPPCPVFRPRRRWRRQGGGGGNQLPDKGYLDSSADSSSQRRRIR